MSLKTIFIYNHTEPSVKNVESHNINGLGLVSNGSVDSILCDCIDTISITDRSAKLAEIFNKLKIGGSVVIKTIDLKIFAKYVLNDQINKDHLSAILTNNQSMFDIRDMSQLLSSRPDIKITEQTNDGLSKTIKMQRIQ
jgi:hypothetical protein